MELWWLYLIAALVIGLFIGIALAVIVLRRDCVGILHVVEYEDEPDAGPSFLLTLMDDSQIDVIKKRSMVSFAVKYKKDRFHNTKR